MPGALFAPFRRRRPTSGSTVLVAPSAPDVPSLPSPSSGATAYYTLLSWTSARATKADIYLNTFNPPTTLVAPHISGTSYVPTLLPGVTYYWQVVAINDGGAATGPVWSFTTPAAATQLIALNGTVLTSGARYDNSSVADLMNAQPNTAAIVFDQTLAPTVGQAVQIGLGTLDAANLLFSGEIQTIDQDYVDTPGSLLWHCTLIDWTFQLNQRRPFGSWVNVSATVIAQQTIAKSAAGFSAGGVQLGLPTVSINFDGSADFATCMTALATACGGYYIGPDYSKSIGLTLSATAATATPITNSNPPLNLPSPITFSTDLSQVRTRVYVKGASSTTPTDLAIGETIVPVVDASQFTPGGGQAIAGRTNGGAQVDVLTYDDVQLAAGGSLVGPGQSPSTAPTVVAAAGTGLGSGVFQYAYTDVTAAGETLPSPLGSVTTGTLAPPSVAFVGVVSSGGGSQPDGYYNYATTFVTATGETTISPRKGPTHNVAGLQLGGNNLPIGPVGTTARNLYRTASQAVAADSNTAPLLFCLTVADNTTTTFTDGRADGSLGAAPPSSNSALAQQVSLTAIAIGTTTVTSRNLYRTVVGGSQLKFLATIADNVTTTAVDSLPDGSLGANVPTGDTSGLTQPTGQVNAGATSLIASSASTFYLTGGWASSGSSGQMFRYTGISGNTLTGIPASGPGSIGTTITYNSQVVPVSALTNVNSGNGLWNAVAQGSTIAIWVQRDNLTAQAALAALEGTDGIRENVITDGRMSEPTLTAACDADLATFASPIVSATYYTRDTATKAGRTVAIALTANAAPYGLTGTFTIQRVDYTFDGPALYPLRKVTASSTAFTLQDLLRRVALT